MARLKSFAQGLLLQSVVWAALLMHIVHQMPGALNVLRFYGVLLLLVAGLQLALVFAQRPTEPPRRYPEHWLFRISGWLFLGVCVWSGMWLLVVASVCFRIALAFNRFAFEREVVNG